MIAGRLIRYARRRAGFTQRALAERAGIPQPAIARLERGEHEPRLATLRRVAHALDADLVLDFAFRGRKRRKHLATL
jgi:transcriptional regulator with XRE-family HTH domain